MAWKLPRKHTNNPNAYPVRQLYLDLIWLPNEDDEEGLKYRFRFREKSSTEQDGECWFPVPQILLMSELYQISEWLIPLDLPQEQHKQANKMLHQLYDIIHNKPLVVHYKEIGQELDKVLQIFIRMNDGGTPLSYSDMLLSIAVAQWTHYEKNKKRDKDCGRYSDW